MLTGSAIHTSAILELCCQVDQALSALDSSVNTTASSSATASATTQHAGRLSVLVRAWNDLLKLRTFLVGDKLSLADLYAACAVKNSGIPFSSASASGHKDMPFLYRWYRHICQLTNIAPVPSAVPQSDCTANDKNISTTSKQLCKQLADSKITDAPAKPKAKNPTASSSATPAPAAEIPAIGHVDIRLGRITSVSRHPDADSLFVEKVDFGPGQPERTIVSGLVGWVREEDLLGKLCPFVFNLKAASMRGIKSEGMILVACNKASHASESSADSPSTAAAPSAAAAMVDLLQVTGGDAASAQPGMRVLVQGMEDVMATPDDCMNPKKKWMETVKEELAVDASGVACYQGKPLVIQGLGNSVQLIAPRARSMPIS